MAGYGISSPGNGVSFIPGTIVPSDGAVVTDGTTTTLANADGSGNLATITLDVSGGSVQEAVLPSNKAVLTDQQASVNVNQFDASGSTAASVSVANNALTLTIANATVRFVVNDQPTTVENVSGSVTASATIGVDQGALTGVVLAAGTSLVSNGTALTVPVTGTFVTTITPAVDANGVITGFTLS